MPTCFISFKPRWCASSSSNANRRCAGCRPAASSTSCASRGGLWTYSSASFRAGSPSGSSTCGGIQSRTALATDFAQRFIDERSYPSLRDAFGTRVNRRQRVFEARRRFGDTAVLGMHAFESLRPATNLTEAANPRATRKRVLLRSREVEEPQRQKSRAVGNAAEKLTPPTKRHFGELDFAFDGHTRAGHQRAHRHDLRAIFIAERRTNSRS